MYPLCAALPTVAWCFVAFPANSGGPFLLCPVAFLGHTSGFLEANPGVIRCRCPRRRPPHRSCALRASTHHTAHDLPFALARQVAALLRDLSGEITLVVKRANWLGGTASPVPQTPRSALRRLV
eukprot:236427-Pleurochrysis_carterae.AAC.1